MKLKRQEIWIWNNVHWYWLHCIDTFTIKLVSQDRVAPLTHNINLSISTATFPSLWNWKHTNAVSLLKKGDPLIAKKYRPVALLPVFIKILIFNQLVVHFDFYIHVHWNHHGSRAGYSRALTSIQIYDTWRWTLGTWWWWGSWWLILVQ